MTRESILLRERWDIGALRSAAMDAPPVPCRGRSGVRHRLLEWSGPADCVPDV